MPYFSIIIPLYNKEKFISDTLNSVINQTFKDYEIIIVDDGSTDQSLNIVLSFKLHNLTLIQQNNQGVAVARNNGISVAKGEYIALIDADDTWYDNHLEELKKQIELFPNAGLYCNNYEILLSPETKKNAVFNFQYKTKCLIVKDYFKSSIINSVAWSSAVAFKRTLFDEIGKFNTRYVTCEDLDLWIRLAIKHDVSFNPITTMSYKNYISDSLTKNENNVIREEFLNSFKKEELKNSSLKLYLDINRYAVALRCKVSKEKELYKRLKKQISPTSINLKQSLLLNAPVGFINGMKKIQKWLIKHGIYLSAFK